KKKSDLESRLSPLIVGRRGRKEAEMVVSCLDLGHQFLLFFLFLLFSVFSVFSVVQSFFSQANPCTRPDGPKMLTMDIAHPTPEPSDAAVRRDRTRIRYALLGAAGLVAGIWLAWLGA